MAKRARYVAPGETYVLPEGGSDMRTPRPAAVAAKAKPVAVDTMAISAFRIAPENPRTIRPKASIESLAQNLQAEGQLAPVICYSEIDHGITWRYITVGGTRLLAAQHAKIPMLWFEELSKDAAIRAGLAEQEGHTPLHPADQATAYAAELDRMNGDGPLVVEAAIETIAKRVGKTSRFVAQRLALAKLYPPILAALRADEISVKQAEAWANADPDRQEEIWSKDPKRYIGDTFDASSIKALIDKADVGEADRLAKFVGEEAYKSAGGMVRQDLFDVDLEPWEKKRAAKGHFDRDLIQKLAKKKLAKAKEKLEAEGWGEVKTTLAVSHASFTEKAKPKTKAERAKYRAEISIDDKGKLVIVRGLRIKTQEAAAAAKTSPAAQANADRQNRNNVTVEYAEQIVGRSLRAKPGVALAAVLAVLAEELLLQNSHRGVMNLDVYQTDRNVKGLSGDGASVAELNRLEKLLKPHAKHLERFIAIDMTDEDRGALLASCVLMMLELNWRPGSEYQKPARDRFVAIATLAGVDLQSHLTPEVEAQVDMPLLRELVGLPTTKKPAKKPAAKKSAKAKK